MRSFGGGAAPKEGGTLSPEVEALARQYRQGVQLEFAKAAVKLTSDLCSERCLSKFGDALGHGDTQCLTKCTERYLDGYAIVEAAFDRFALSHTHPTSN